MSKEKQNLIVGEFYEVRGKKDNMIVDTKVRVLSLDEESAYCKVFDNNHKVYLSLKTIKFKKTDKRPRAYPIHVENEI